MAMDKYSTDTVKEAGHALAELKTRQKGLEKTASPKQRQFVADQILGAEARIKELKDSK